MYLKRGASEKPSLTRAVLDSSAAERSSRAIPAPARNSTAGPPSSARATSGAPSPTRSSSPGTLWPGTHLARPRQTHPVLGQSSDLSGYELAVQINVHLATLGLPMVPTPSPVPVFPANPVVGLNITNIGGAVSLPKQYSFF